MYSISPPESPLPNKTHPQQHKKLKLIPTDLIIDILSRLPVKTLCKFRCVSKQWLFLLLTDKPFVTLHRKQSMKTPLLLSRKYSSGEKNEEDEVCIELTSMGMEGNVVNKVKASISGPIYTFVSCGSLVVICCSYCAYLFNPGSKLFLHLPKTSFVFSSFNVGFGYICNSNEYKIVHLFSDSPDQLMGCQVLTLRDGEVTNSGNLGAWRRVQDCVYKVHTNCSAICVSGILYWKITEHDTESSREAILSFDLEKEEFGVINYPKCYTDYDPRVLCLSGFRGSLCIVECSPIRKSRIEMWVLNGNGNGNGENFKWVKGYSINLSKLDGKTEMKGLVTTNDEDGEILMNIGEHGLVYYNPKTEVFRRIENSGVLEWYKKPCIYYDTFFSLHSK